MNKPSNAPAPDELLSTAREALKTMLRESDAYHAYTILMAMNAMGIAARAMRAEEPVPVRAPEIDMPFKEWVRQGDESAVTDPGLLRNLRRHVAQKLAVANPRFRAEAAKETP
ncbi:MAG: hypothetical protein MAG794_00462 [Gammaproteobacteria bacterium]|nr:hypothetical protein [Gammaproteobacteria bacterium]